VISVRETDEDLRWLQELIDRSFEGAGAHLRSIFRPERRLTASGLVSALSGPRQAAVATVSARGEPRVAPVDVVVLRGRFHFGTSAAAARIRHLRARPAVSLTYFERDELAVLVHGKAVLVEPSSPGFRDVESAFLTTYGGEPAAEADGVVYVRIEPRAVLTFDRRGEMASNGR
jgi:hypothetical protein